MKKKEAAHFIRLKSFFSHTYEYLLRRWVVFTVVAVLILLSVLVLKGFLQKESALHTVAVRSSALGTEIAVQGNVVPRDEVTLSFEVSGRVASLPVSVGDTVARGQTLASLVQSDVAAQIQNLEALRDTAAVELAHIKAGTRAEDVAIAESTLASARNQEIQAYGTLGQTLENAYEVLDDAIRTKADQFFDNPRKATPYLLVPTDTELKSQVEHERVSLELTLQGLQYRSFLEPSASDIERVKEGVAEARSFLDHMAVILNTMEGRSSVSSATVDAYKALISAARLAVTNYNSNLTASITAYTQAQAGVKTSEAQLALKKAGPTEYDISAQEARVRAAEASLNAARALLRQRAIVAPFNGTVTDVTFSQGEVVGPTSGGITLITAQSLEMESYVPEIYVARIHIGDPVAITLDAYPEGESFNGQVTFVDPSATIKDGVSTYRIIIGFDESADERLRSGMNGDIRIQASQNPAVIAVPKSALVHRDGKYYVQVPIGENRVLEREIVIGSFNEADVAEVIVGLSDGDVIVLNPIE